MTSAVKTMPIWPGLDMSRQVKSMKKTATRGSSGMVTVKAARIIEEKSLRATVRK